ncbi:30S ribosomal protein S4, partial [Dehalococcoidia bacterium]|nr:30S ribosomal protein S4 [Dehalococcoidia bacterium]
MGKYNGPSCRLCRRAGEKLFLKGDRCFTPRCAVERRHNPPGDVSNRRRRPTDYAVHLREKQKARQMYGVMEGQFRKYMTAAFNTPGVSGLNLLRSLERRLDNVVFLLNFADSRKQARQFVNHGHFTVNGVKTDIPSYQVRIGDVIGWKETTKSSDFYKDRTDGLPKRLIPGWLAFNQDDMSGQITSLPADEDLQESIN